MPAQVSLSHLLVIQEFLAGSSEANRSIDHDIAAVRQIQRMVRILLNQKDCGSFVGYFTPRCEISVGR